MSFKSDYMWTWCNRPTPLAAQNVINIWLKQLKPLQLRGRLNTKYTILDYSTGRMCCVVRWPSELSPNLHPWVLLFEVKYFDYSILESPGRQDNCVPVRMPMQMYRCSRLEAKELRTRPAEDSKPPRITVALQERWFPRKPPTGAGNTVCVNCSYFTDW